SLEKKKYKGPKEKLPLYLAGKKALSIDANHEDIIIGADQILLFRGKVYDKPKSMREAKTHLTNLSGKTHQLISGTTIIKDKKILWSHTNKAKMKMRPITKKEIEEYLLLSGEKILKSVGAYNIEGYGVKLFSKIEGDFYSIVGLPLIPLLNKINKMEKNK
ncbi:MAG: Maf family protein, partial [Pseudomonadota bacterium]|nr:Maf family protein [Pseudomonadota bacterium]